MSDLRGRIKAHEGLRLKPYTDSVGVLTIYYGHKCLPGETYNNTIEEAEAYLERDISIARKALVKIFPDFAMASQPRREVLVELLFNLGEPRFRGFKKMLAAIKDGDWDKAADELKDSRWYTQVKTRGEELVRIMREG